MHRLILILVAIILSGCLPAANQSPPAAPTGKASPSPQPDPTTPGKASMSSLRDYGPAPELTNTIWLNVDHPLRLADLRGKVVLLEMWTFECINCQHVTPTLIRWYQSYADQGLVIIGNHFPEFSFEADLGNLKKAVADQKIPYAVAQDNDGATWQAYHNQYWPTIYLIDRAGHIRYSHIGEGGYDMTEAAIQDLLAEPSS